MNRELTQAEAIAFHGTGAWEALSLLDRAAFQLWQDRLCMPFEKFQEAVEHALGRPVFNHEFADREALQLEFGKEREAPTLAQIMDKIPAGKWIIVVTP